jgi:signal transduction histidine kinase
MVTLLIGQANAQDTLEIAELQKGRINANDNQLLNIYGKLGLIYSEANSDSAIFYGEKAVALSRKLKQPFYEAMLLTLTGYDHIAKGDYSIALSMLLNASKLSDEDNITKNILPSDYIRKFISDYPDEVRLRILKGYVLNNLGVLYSQTGNKKLSKQVLLDAKALVERDRKDYFLLGGIYNNLAFVYLDYNDLDSAIYYQKMNLQIDDLGAIKLYQGSSLTVLADFYSYQGQVDSSWKYFYKGIGIIKEKNVNKVALGQTYLSMAALYAEQENLDSAYWYAKEGAFILNGSGNTSLISYGYGMLSDVYGAMGIMDSAYYYLTLSNGIEDSLQRVKMDNLHRFYNDVFDEQARLKDKENRAVNQRNRVIILSSIVGFLIMAAVALALKRLNRKVKQSNLLLNATLTDLRDAQALLVQSEKMASLGELTAGIAHEIQNPLNFVNNFSEVSKELMEELVEEVDKDNMDEVKLIANDVVMNLEKIHHHGKRADDIVKGMLQHSRRSTGVKELTDLNALADEYLRLAYHGLRAKDNQFNAQFETDFDPYLPKLNVISQDIGRVLLNLVNNAFYAVNDKRISGVENKRALVKVVTRRLNNMVEVRVKDNGPGIPDHIRDKIFQPFFTTKPTGQGTGLGLSLSYDIIKAHGGELKVNTKEGEGSEFIVQLPTV